MKFNFFRGLRKATFAVNLQLFCTFLWPPKKPKKHKLFVSFLQCFSSTIANLIGFLMFWPGHTSKRHRIHRTFAKRSGLESQKCTAPKRDSVPRHLGRAGNFPCSPKVPGDRVPLGRRALFAFQAAFFWESSMYSMTLGSVPWSKH